jgi:transposase InsO family protein
LRINRSSFYYWQKAKVIRLEKELPDKLLIEKIFNNHKKLAGYRTIRMDLENKYGVIMNTKKIRRLMNKYDLNTQVRRKNPYKEIMKKTQEHATCANILNRNFNQTKPFTTLCTDITYLYYGKCEKAYLSAVKDIATGEIIAYKVARHLTMPIVLETINNLNKAIDLNNVLIHSDQGFHYTNPEYRKLLKNHNVIQSMSRKGNCIDNAPMESFFGHLKDELDYKYCKTFEELVEKIDEYMYYYNNERYQWSKNKMTPVEYRSHLLFAS